MDSRQIKQYLSSCFCQIFGIKFDGFFHYINHPLMVCPNWKISWNMPKKIGKKLKKKALFNLPRFRVHNQFITITRTMYIYYLKIYPKQCRFKMMISFYQMVHHHHPPRVPRVAGIMQWLEVLSLLQCFYSGGRSFGHRQNNPFWVLLECKETWKVRAVFRVESTIFSHQ